MLLIDVVVVTMCVEETRVRCYMKSIISVVADRVLKDQGIEKCDQHSIR
jgi:hypothetical protein